MNCDRMRRLRIACGSIGWLLAALATAGACSSSSDSTGSTTAPLDCNVCDVMQFNCTASGASAGTAALDRLTPDGCAGYIVSPEGTLGLWLHCDSGRVCVEHEDECYKGTSTARSFAYTFSPGGAERTVTCTAP